MALTLMQPHSLIKFDLCCCIMNEVDIRVTTKQSDVSCGLPLRGKWTQRVVIDIYGRNGERRSSMQKEEEMDVDYMPDDDILSEEEEESDIFESPQQPQPQGAECSGSSSISTNPICIPSPLGQGPLSPGFSNVTPFNCSIMRRFSPVGSLEAVSPLSSGYGSAPRFFSSIGTQTPPATPVFFETRIQLQFSESHSQDMADVGQLRLRQRLFHQENSRTRFYSEGSQREDAPANEGERALPDLVQRTFRDRANSAPTRPSQSATEAGRELRRISDEFMHHFQRGRRNSFLDRFFQMLGGRDQAPQRSRSSQDAAEDAGNEDPTPHAVGSGI